MFALLQNEVSKAVWKRIKSGEMENRGVTEKWLLWDQTYKTWRSAKFKRRGAKAFRRLGEALERAIELDGDRTYM